MRRGSGYGFARSVKKQLDKGTCLKLYTDDRDYVAEEATCEEVELQQKSRQWVKHVMRLWIVVLNSVPFGPGFGSPGSNAGVCDYTRFQYS
jgi:tRNA G46 methylase TrmB